MRGRRRPGHAAPRRALPAGTRASLATVLAVAGLLLVAAALYRPWEWRPIGIGDAAEYLPLLRRGHGVVDRIQLLTGFYATTYGRFNPTAVAVTAVEWTLVGADAVAWYWLRFAEMGTIVALTYAIQRRVGASAAGAFLGASLFVIASAASWGWILLSTGEPLAVLLLLLALRLAIDYRDARRWPLRALAIAALCGAALLAKEMAACLVPLVVLIGACHVGGGALSWPRYDRRTATLVLGAVAATGAAAAAVLRVALVAGDGTYGRQYDVAGSTLGDFAVRFASALGPLTPDHASERFAVVAVDALFWTVVALGMRERLRTARHGPNALAWLGFALVPPFVGAVLYTPWSAWSPYYAMPMLVGPSMLLAHAVTWLRVADREVPRQAAWVLAATLLLSSSFAWHRAHSLAARFRTYDAMARGGAYHSPVAEVVVLSPDPTRRAWPTDGELWRLYAIALEHVTVPATRTAPCAAAHERPTTRALVVSSTAACGPLPSATIVHREVFRYVDWSRLAFATDSSRFEGRLDTASVATHATTATTGSP